MLDTRREFTYTGNGSYFSKQKMMTCPHHLIGQRLSQLRKMFCPTGPCMPSQSPCPSLLVNSCQRTGPGPISMICSPGRGWRLKHHLCFTHSARHCTMLFGEVRSLMATCLNSSAGSEAHHTVIADSPHDKMTTSQSKTITTSQSQTITSWRGGGGGGGGGGGVGRVCAVAGRRWAIRGGGIRLHGKLAERS